MTFADKIRRLKELAARAKKAPYGCADEGRFNNNAVYSHECRNLAPELIEFVEAARELAKQDCPYACMDGDCGAEWEMEPKPCPACKSARDFLRKYFGE